MNFIIFDLEATCWANPRPNAIQEIIEIGAYKLNQYGEVEDTFCRFVQPVKNPYLSFFCTELTTIQQKDVARAYKFPKVVEDFQEWIGVFDDEDYLLCSWGDFDIEILLDSCHSHDLEMDWLDKYIDLKAQYREINRLNKAVGLKKAIRREGFEFTGIAHRGIYDAENLAKIFVSRLDEWRY